MAGGRSVPFGPPTVLQMTEWGHIPQPSRESRTCSVIALEAENLIWPVEKVRTYDKTGGDGPGPDLVRPPLGPGGRLPGGQGPSGV